jgi:hypothetical protein
VSYSERHLTYRKIKGVECFSLAIGYPKRVMLDAWIEEAMCIVKGQYRAKLEVLYSLTASLLVGWWKMQKE